MKIPSPASWTLPSNLKRAQLQRIATLIGAPLTGTKPQLLRSIHELLATQQAQHGRNAAFTSPTASKELRVLSIDMGIRNLAYAFLTSEVCSKSNSTTLSFARPTLCQWQRTGLVNVNRAGMAMEASEVGQISMASGRDDNQPTAADESYEPHIMAGHAYNFAKYCASLRPSHILIERQRFRSGGHSAVQEWSLRVGMLEGMLYSTFQTLMEEGLLADTTIEPMLPMRVNKFWFADQDIPATGKQAKLAKIAIVSDMLKAVNTKKASFALADELRDVIGGFGVKAGRDTTVEKAARPLQKLDDMSDALLQALAWLRWQENRIKLVTDGPSGLGIDE